MAPAVSKYKNLKEGSNDIAVTAQKGVRVYGIIIKPLALHFAGFSHCNSIVFHAGKARKNNKEQ